MLTLQHFSWATVLFRDEDMESENIATQLEQRASKDHFRIKNTPAYLFINSAKLKTIDEYIDLTPILSDELKKTDKTCLYELIGIDVGVGYHNTAYIKDQWETNPSWYYVDDMAARAPGNAHKKLAQLPKFSQIEGKTTDGQELDFLIYKRVDNKPDKKIPENLARQMRETEKPGEGQDLEMLVQALRDLAV